MSVLKDSWLKRTRELTRERQQQNIERQRETLAALDKTSQMRQECAETERQQRSDERSDFVKTRAELMEQSRLQQQANARILRADLNQFKAQLQEGTQAFLADTTQARAQMSARLHDQLDGFRLHLAQDVEQLLGDMATLRSQESAVRRAELQRFHTELESQMQHFLISTAEDRSAMGQAVAESLQDFHRLLVQDVRQMRGETQEMMADIERAHLERSTILRAKLHAFHRHLKAQMWALDKPVPVSEPVKPVRPTVARPPAPRAVVSTPQPTVSTPKPVVNTPQPVMSTPPVVTAPQPAASIPQPVASVPQPVVIPQPVVAARLAPAPKPAPAAAIPLTPPELPANALQVYELLGRTGGSLMHELESALSINRFQATDALRLLIDGNLVVKRGRTYQLKAHATEEISE